MLTWIERLRDFLYKYKKLYKKLYKKMLVEKIDNIIIMRMT